MEQAMIFWVGSVGLVMGASVVLFGWLIFKAWRDRR